MAFCINSSEMQKLQKELKAYVFFFCIFKCINDKKFGFKLNGILHQFFRNAKPSKGVESICFFFCILNASMAKHVVLN